MMSDSMALPAGKTCGDCFHFKRTCAWLISCNPANITCDWSPSRFLDIEDAQRYLCERRAMQALIVKE